MKLAAAIVLLGAAPATAATIYGFEFGKPLGLPQCAPNAIATKVTCQEAPRTMNGGPGVPEVQINWRPDDWPLVVRYGRAWAVIVDDRLAGFRFMTNGAGSQDVVMKLLNDKYGKPTDVTSSQVQNMAGASFESTTAIWRGGEVDVTYYGTINRLDTGEVHIDTPLVTAMRRREALTIPGPKM